MRELSFRFFSFPILFIGFLLVLAACVPPGTEETVVVGVRIDLNDPVTRRIYEHQNNRNTDSLLVYLAAEDPSYRYQAARAFGSFPALTPAARTALIGQLTAPNELIASAAAFALGQSGDAAVADSLTTYFDATGDYRAYNATLLTAVGKTGDARLQEFIANISTYKLTDTLLLRGQAYGLFHFAARQLRSPAGDRRMLDLVLDPAAPAEARRPAAWYLQRYPLSVDTTADARLRTLLRTEADADVLMGVVRAIGRLGTSAGRVALTRALRGQADWRVRTEILRALADYDYSSVREPVVETLDDEHPLVRGTAAAFLRDNGIAADATFYRQLARDSTAGDVRYELYAAAQRHLPLYFADYRGFLNYDLQQAFANTGDAYERAAVIRALGEYPWNYRNIYELYQGATQKAVRTAAAEALAGISAREDFLTFFRNSSRRVRLDLSIYFREMIQRGEVGPAYHAAAALENDPEAYGPLYVDQAWLRESMDALQLPRDIESYRAIDDARAALAGRPAPTPRQADVPAKAIDWDRLATDGNKTVTLRTSAGAIDLRLYPESAPATVSSFLELASGGYYDGKVFHRVVPNFVAQGGGPAGDGFGAEPFRLRTETPGLVWDRPGLLGMASAGKDTEGVQFFITHRATPHLNGGYTIFGEVVEGQEIADQLTIGTRIESISVR